MDVTKRYITKICRVAQRYAHLALKDVALGTSEYECLHYIRKNRGITQEGLREIMGIDKSAITRMLINLEKKGYLLRKASETDKRAKQLFLTDKATEIKGASSSVESFFYEWLIEDINPDEKKVFLKVLNELYAKSKRERVENFVNIKKRDVEFYGKAKD